MSYIQSTHGASPQHVLTCVPSVDRVAWWRNGLSRGREFDPRPGLRNLTILGKLFTHMFLDADSLRYCIVSLNRLHLPLTERRLARRPAFENPRCMLLTAGNYTDRRLGVTGLYSARRVGPSSVVARIVRQHPRDVDHAVHDTTAAVSLWAVARFARLHCALG